MKRRVVVSGMGIVSALGCDVDQAFKRAVNGESGIVGNPVSAPVRDFDSSAIIPKRLARRQDLFSQYAMVAAHQALRASKLELDDPTRCGVLIGTGLGGMKTFASVLNTVFEKGFDRVPPLFIPMVIPNMASGNVAIMAGAKGHVSTVTTACAAATHALGDAFRLIRDGYQEVMLAGGSEAAVSPYTLAGFKALSTLTKATDPSLASRPFDSTRDGFVLGEGAGVLVLEEYDRAIKRGAPIFGEIIGYGVSGDAYHITAPSGEGAKLAMALALKDAGIETRDVQYINAHGTSTPLNDAMETKAIREVFQEHADHLLVSSTKSVHGHALGATGAIEAILTLKAMEQGQIPPTINLHHPDPECDLDYVANVAREATVNIAMSNSFGFGGHNAVLVLRRGHYEH